MTEDGNVMNRADADERAWREIVERTVRSGDDCSERAARLRASRAEFERNDSSDGGGYGKAAVGVLLVLAIPVILYSETITPAGGINYAGMGTGFVLMVAASLAHL